MNTPHTPQMSKMAWETRCSGYTEQIIDSIRLSIPEPWHSAQMEVTVYHTHVKWTCSYVAAKNGAVKPFAPRPGGQQAYLDLHAAWFQRSGKETWSRSITTLDAKQSKVEYFYEGDFEGRAMSPVPPPHNEAGRSGAGPTKPPGGA